MHQGVRGVNHVTLAVADLERAFSFYCNILGCAPVARWPAGAYLRIGPTWLALVQDDKVPAMKRPDYSHLALTVSPSAFGVIRDRLQGYGAACWQKNQSEGDSWYFLDPDGHKLEIHVTDLEARLADLRTRNIPGWQEFGPDGELQNPEHFPTGITEEFPSFSPLPRRETSDGRRNFACFPAAVLVFVINEHEDFLLLRHPQRQAWEVVNGALEDGETVVAGAVREAAEEAGPEVKLRPLGAFHVSSFHYDWRAPFMLSIAYLAAFVGGTVQPGDDMQGSEWAWVSCDRILSREFPLLVPPDQPWLFARAKGAFRLWREDRLCLQPQIE